MASSLSSGLAGLRAHQQFIDVVGNNIANANTPGYRGQRATFSELLAQTLRPASGPSATAGGTNPMQVGLGVRLGSIVTNTSQGGLIATGRTLDLAIEGNGFFALTNGTQRLYSRIGTFGFDINEDLVDTRTGFKVLSPSGATIQIDSGQVVPAKATTQVDFKGNFPAKVTGPKAHVLTTATPFSNTTLGTPATATTDLNDLADNTIDYVPGDTITITGTDVDGTAISATFTYGTDGTTLGDLTSFIDTQLTGATATIAADGSLVFSASAAGVSQMSIQIATDGKTAWSSHAFATTTAGTAPDEVVTSIEVYDPAGLPHNVTLTFARQVSGSWTLTATMPASEGTVTGGTITGIQFGSNGSFAGVTGPTSSLQFSFVNQPATQSIALDFGTIGGNAGLTQFGDEASAQAKSQDGYGAGTLASLSLNGNGEILGFFSNGVENVLGQVGVATFANQEGLVREGDTLYGETANSGIAVLGTGGTGGVGFVRSGALEGSNVDIAREFVNLIEAQRGFQASARVISTTDQILAELVNIVR